jgi:hypothetical protein
MIRFAYSYLKPVALFLSIVVLFQCCSVYDKNPIALEQAIDETRLRIITTDGKKYILEEIYYKNDSLLYGLLRKRISETKEMALPKKQITEHIYDNDKHGRKDTFVTVDGKYYKFDSFYIVNDTIYGLQTTRSNKEILIPVETIKEIHLYNPDKGKERKVLIVFGGVGLILVGLITWFIIALSKIEPEG